MIDAFRENYAPKDADGQVLRVVDRFGLVAAAGELACDFGVVPWRKARPLKQRDDVSLIGLTAEAGRRRGKFSRHRTGAPLY